MKNKKKKCFRKFLFILLVFFALLFILNKSINGLSSFFADNKISLSNNVKKDSYDVIKLDNNPNYKGIGQKKVSNTDGYFTTFTDISGKTYKEYKQNGTSSWANNNYWDGTMKDTGCGITAISIILSAYGHSETPNDLRLKYYPVLNGDEISKELSRTFKLSNSDFCYDSVRLSEKYITENLRKNTPVLICVWNQPKNNRCTTASHYMVLLACDDNGMVYVSNPNRIR